MSQNNLNPDPSPSEISNTKSEIAPPPPHRKPSVATRRAAIRKSLFDNPPPLEVFDPNTPLPPYTGPILTPPQFEALCRHALSRELALPLSSFQTGHLESSTRASGNVKHQIDIYWTSRDGVCDFLCFANAKFRRPENIVNLTDLMTLLGVQHDIKAHKAMLITNTAFSASVIAQAQDKGVSLLIVRPADNFDPSLLPLANPTKIADCIHLLSKNRVSPLYHLQILHRAFDPTPHRASAPDPNPHSEFRNPQSESPDPPPASPPSEEQDFSYLIESAAPAEDSFNNKMLPNSALTNRMIDNPQELDHPSPPPFGIRSK